MSAARRAHSVRALPAAAPSRHGSTALEHVLPVGAPP